MIIAGAWNSHEGALSSTPDGAHGGPGRGFPSQGDPPHAVECPRAPLRVLFLTGPVTVVLYLILAYRLRSLVLIPSALLPYLAVSVLPAVAIIGFGRS